MSLTVLVVDERYLSPAQEASLLDALPAARRAQLLSWPDARARQRSLLGSRLLRAGLAQAGHGEGAIARLRYQAGGGKPTLDLPLDFSISHCEGRIVCALSAEGAVGVDVEKIGELTADGFRMHLSAAERQWAGKDPLRFYTLWTRKEAVLKANGSAKLQQMGEFDMIEGHATFAGSAWRAFPVDAGAGFIAHVAAPDVPTEVNVDRIVVPTPGATSHATSFL